MTEQPPLEDLSLLVLVAKVGSIGQAAAEQGLSQPSVSRRMTGLERSLGVSLLHRSKRGTVLTPAGLVVVDWAATLLAAADQFTRSVRSLQEQSDAAVRVAVSMTIGEHYAPSWLAAVARGSSEPEISLTVTNSTEVAALVESGAADLGFLESPTVVPTLHRRTIGWDRIIVAVRSDHAWAKGRSTVSVEEFADAGLAVREPGSGTRETVERALQERGMRLRPGLVMPSNTALKSAALAGMGPVVVSERTLTNEIASGQLLRVRVADLDFRRPLSAVWRRGEVLSAAAGALLDAASERPGEDARPAPPPRKVS